MIKPFLPCQFCKYYKFEGDVDSTWRFYCEKEVNVTYNKDICIYECEKYEDEGYERGEYDEEEE